MTNSATSKLNLIPTLTDVFAKLDAQNIEAGNNSAQEMYMQCYGAAESILLDSRDRESNPLAVGVQVRLLTGAHAGRTGVISSTGTPASTWNVTLNATSATVNERPANLIILKSRRYVPLQKAEAAELRRTARALAEVPLATEPVALALQRSKKNEEMLDAILEEVLFLSGRLRKLDKNPDAKKMYQKSASEPSIPETPQTNATVSAQADQIASIEGNIDILAKEVYWLSNCLRELDPDRASLYAQTSSATPRTPRFSLSDTSTTYMEELALPPAARRVNAARLWGRAKTKLLCAMRFRKKLLPTVR